MIDPEKWHASAWVESEYHLLREIKSFSAFCCVFVLALFWHVFDYESIVNFRTVPKNGLPSTVIKCCSHSHKSHWRIVAYFIIFSHMLFGLQRQDALMHKAHQSQSNPSWQSLEMALELAKFDVPCNVKVRRVISIAYPRCEQKWCWNKINLHRNPNEISQFCRWKSSSTTLRIWVLDPLDPLDPVAEIFHDGPGPISMITTDPRWCPRSESREKLVYKYYN